MLISKASQLWNWNLCAKADRKIVYPHRTVRTVMRRAFIRLQKYILVLWLRRNPAVTETPIVKARTARVLMDGLKRKVSRLRDWNLPLRMLHVSLTSLLEKKSISITRLKLKVLISASTHFWSWKEKYLDYEIETLLGVAWSHSSRHWKEKYLDYEIETNRG